MKTKLALVFMMATILLTASACSGEIMAAGDTEDTDLGLLKQVTVDASYDGQDIHVPAGQLLVITLESNQTTGFRWELSEPIDEGILALILSEFEPGEKAKQNPPIYGAGGTEVWTFEVLTAGTTTIAMEYNQPWDGGEKAVQTFTLTVVVE